MEVAGKVAVTKNKSLDKKNQFCEPCQFENTTTNAKGICRECEEYMCDVCFRHHLKGKQNRTHELIDVHDYESAITTNKSAREVAMCQHHDNETIKFYCREHKAVGCGDCIVLEHSACKPEYIKDLSKGIQETEDFKNLRRKLEQLDCQNKANHEKIDNDRRDCIKKHEEVLNEIRKYRKDINTYLDQAEAAIISEAKQLMSETENLLDQLENDCEDLASKIESLEQKLDTTVHRDNELFIQVVRNKTNIVELEQEIAKHVQGISKVEHFDFVPDKQLCSQMKFTAKLGNLKFSYPNKSEHDETSVAINRKRSIQTRADTHERDSEPPAEPPSFHDVQEADEQAPTIERAPTLETVLNTETPSHDVHPRLCHIKKWPYFQGYGFKLHAKKDKYGHYIWQVDADSPAEDGGLRKGDRIIEINGENSEDESHQQIIESIKAGGDKTSLLVVDADADEYYKNNGIRIRSDMPEVITIETRGKEVPAMTFYPRQCHVIKWPDFPGYGFNLFSEKERDGQYINKIDDNSPAQDAGLLENDRIIEVNNENIENETHHEVIARIKAGNGETKLLVVDKEADAYYKSHGITVTSSMQEVKFLRTTRKSPKSSSDVINGDTSPAPVPLQASQPKGFKRIKSKLAKKKTVV